MSGKALRLRLGDYGRVLRSALLLVDDPVALLTITAPGDATPEWNRSSARRFRKLDRRCKSQLRREGQRTLLYARIAQRQRRGLDHLHLVLRCRVEDRRAIRRYVELLREHGPSFGFGFVDDPFHRRRGKDGRVRDAVFQEARVAGYYLSGYLTDSLQLAAMVEAGDHSFRALWVNPELSRKSGVTMRRLRRARHGFWVVLGIRQGSRPRLPVWWGDIRERVAVIHLLRLEDRGPPASVAVAVPG